MKTAHMLSDFTTATGSPEWLLMHALVTQPDLSDLENACLIGNGSYSFVFSAKLISSDKHVAVKVTRDYFPCVHPAALRELRAMHMIRHPNVLEFERVFIVTGAIAFQTKLYNATLHNFITESFTDYLPNVIHKVAQGLQAAHAVGFLHRDVKPANILIGETCQDVVLGDWGMSRRIGDSSPHFMSNNVITTAYAPPEILCNSEPYGPPADVWSLGMTMLEVLIQGFPFRTSTCRGKFMVPMVGFLGTDHLDMDETEWLRKAIMRTSMSCSTSLLPLRKMPGSVRDKSVMISPEVYTVVRGMLHYDPKKRWTLDQVLGHPWFINTAFAETPVLAVLSPSPSKPVQQPETHTPLYVCCASSVTPKVLPKPGWNSSLNREFVLRTLKFTPCMHINSYLCAMHMSAYVTGCTEQHAFACMTLAIPLCAQFWKLSSGIRDMTDLDNEIEMESKAWRKFRDHFGISSPEMLAQLETDVLQSVNGVIPDIPWKIFGSISSHSGEWIVMYLMSSPELMEVLGLTEQNVFDLAMESSQVKADKNAKLKTIWEAMILAGVWNHDWYVFYE